MQQKNSQFGRIVKLIRRAIRALKDGTLFTTRQLLAFGFNRDSLDKALARMHNSGELERVARGVYRKKQEGQPPPSLFEIARIKAIAFGRTLYPCTKSLLDAANSSEESIEASIKSVQGTGSDLTVETDGPSSAFSTVVGSVRMKHVAPRKIYLERQLNSSSIGLLLRTLWSQGRRAVDWMEVEHSMSISRLGRTHRRQLRASGMWMPEWIRKKLAFEFQPLARLDDHAIYSADQLHNLKETGLDCEPPPPGIQYELSRLLNAVSL